MTIRTESGYSYSQQDGQLHITIIGRQTEAQRAILHGQGFRWTNSTRSWFRIATPGGLIALANAQRMLDNL